MADLKFFEVRGDVYRIKRWRKKNPDFFGPPSLVDIFGGWFCYHCVAINEEDAIQGAIEQYDQFSELKTERDAFYIKKPRLIEWVSFHTNKAKQNVK